MYTYKDLRPDNIITVDAYDRQEAQLPQRNSASAAHMEGGYALQPTPPPATPMRMVESETRNKSTSSEAVH